MPPSRVLLIEDNADIRLALKELLEDLGHQVDVAVDGHAGLQKQIALRPDVALVDVGLPASTATKSRGARGRRRKVEGCSSSRSRATAARRRACVRSRRGSTSTW